MPQPAVRWDVRQRLMSLAEWGQRAQPRRGRPHRAAHARKIWSRDSHGDRSSREKLGEAMGGFNSRQFQEMLENAQKQAQDLQQKMKQTVVDASSGGGTVTIKMNGQKQVLQTRIDPEAVKAGDVEMLQDLVTAAVNAAGQKVDEAMQSTVGGMLGGMGLPGI